MPRLTMKSLAAAPVPNQRHYPSKPKCVWKNYTNTTWQFPDGRWHFLANHPYLVHYRSCHLSRHRPSCFVRLSTTTRLSHIASCNMIASAIAQLVGLQIRR